MSTKLYVGNLPRSITQNDLETLFSREGAVTEVDLVNNRFDRERGGFAFVTMATLESAYNAIFALNGREVQGRVLRVKKARSDEEREATSATGSRDYPRMGRSRMG